MNLWPELPPDIEALDALESTVAQAIFATVQLLPACLIWRLIAPARSLQAGPVPMKPGITTGSAEAGHHIKFG